MVNSNPGQFPRFRHQPKPRKPKEVPPTKKGVPPPKISGKKGKQKVKPDKPIKEKGNQEAVLELGDSGIQWLALSPSPSPSPSPTMAATLAQVQQQVQQILNLLKASPIYIQPFTSPPPAITGPSVSTSSSTVQLFSSPSVSAPSPAIQLFNNSTPTSNNYPGPSSSHVYPSVGPSSSHIDSGSWLDDEDFSSILDELSPEFLLPAPVNLPTPSLSQPPVAPTPSLPPTPSLLPPTPSLPQPPVVLSPPSARPQPRSPPLVVTPRPLASPEKALVKVEGRNTLALRKLAIMLARGCVIGDAVLYQSSPSGRGSTPLPPEKMLEIRRIVRRRAKSLDNDAFEEVWALCVKSISKTCQYLRSGKLKMYSVKF